VSRARWTTGAALAAALVLALGLGAAGSEPRILWWQGRAASWDGNTGVVLSAAGELLRLDAGAVERVPLRADGRTFIEATAETGGTAWLVDEAGAVLRREPDGTVREIGRTPFDIPTLAARRGRVWVARSARNFTFRPEADTAALALSLDRSLRPVGRAGAVRIPTNPFLAQLANAGHLLTLPDGGIVFASFVRDEVVRYDSVGRGHWILRRGLTHQTPDPTLLLTRTAQGRPEVAVDYAPVNLGVALGPDGRLYVLSTPQATTAASRLDVVDLESGRVVSTRNFPTALPTIAVDRRGRITTPEPERLLPGADPDRREAFPSFDVEGLDSGRVRLADFAGRPLLVNFWASWCGPCREEMPALDSLVRSFGGRLGFAALSDDVAPEAARGFIREHRFAFPVGLGLGRLKARFHYVGLPHTVLLDAEGRVVRQWSGYGGKRQLEAIAALVDAELARAQRAADATHAHGH
jgi:thiol-disulfide isomerase/thioredoxin